MSPSLVHRSHLLILSFNIPKVGSAYKIYKEKGFTKKDTKNAERHTNWQFAMKIKRDKNRNKLYQENLSVSRSILEHVGTPQFRTGFVEEQCPYLRLPNLLKYGCGLDFSPWPINPGGVFLSQPTNVLCSEMTRVKLAQNGADCWVMDRISDTSASVRSQQYQSLPACRNQAPYNGFVWFSRIPHLLNIQSYMYT